MSLFGRAAPAGDVGDARGGRRFRRGAAVLPVPVGPAQSRTARHGSTAAQARCLRPRGGAGAASTLPTGAGTRCGTFSTGMRQRLGIAAALLRAPRLLVLDEPTIGLDPANARRCGRMLRHLADARRRGLLSSHNMAEVAEICDRVADHPRGPHGVGGTQADLHVAAPAPAYRVWTSDDERAAAVVAVCRCGWRPADPAVDFFFLRKRRPSKFFKEVFLLQKDNNSLPEEMIRIKEESSELYKALGEIKDTYRKVIVLRKIKGFSIEDTAKILSWSESKVKSTLFRAIPALKKQLIKEGYLDEKTI